MILPVVAYGHPTLKKRAVEIEQDYPDLNEFIENMWETMYKAVGVGLAAPQVNKGIRLFVIDAAPYKDEFPEVEGFKKVFINAEILEETGEEWEYNEACLSVPGLAEYVSRKPKIKIKYQDENFEEHIEEYDGMLARIIQHEYDHIEGVVFVERVSNMKKLLLKNKLKDISTGKVNASYKMIFAPVKRKR